MLDLGRKDRAAPVRIVFEGEEITATAGQSLAVALLAAGVRQFRTTPVGGVPRGPYCMMGVCFDCLVVVDGLANVQACMTPVSDGMRVMRQGGAREPGAAGEEEPAT